MAIKELALWSGAYGSHGPLDWISDAEPVVAAWYHLVKLRPELFPKSRRLHWYLSRESPDYYEGRGDGDHDRAYAPPFCAELVKAGPRFGWRWTNGHDGGSCETNWLDPEPKHSDPDYNKYVEVLNK